jgi:hypothetical protein
MSSYNAERMHQSLDYKTPDQVYAAGSGGGARIVDHFGQQKDLLEEKMGHLSVFFGTCQNMYFRISLFLNDFLLRYRAE